MDDGRHDASMGRAVTSQLVGDQPTGLAALPLQQLAEEAFRGSPITARLDENIDDITILVDCTPEILALALDRHEDLVQVPSVAQPTLPTLQTTSVLRTELEAPKPDRLVGNRDAALRQQILNVPKAHTESMVKPYGVADDLGWKSVSAVARHVAFHRQVCHSPTELDSTRACDRAKSCRGAATDTSSPEPHPFVPDRKPLVSAASTRRLSRCEDSS